MSIKKIACLISMLTVFGLVGCGEEKNVESNMEVQQAEENSTLESTSSEETEVSENINSESFSTELDFSNTVTPVNVKEEKENPFAMYDGYYSYTDDNSYSCYLKIEDGILYLLTRGEKTEDEKSELYIEDNKAYVELDGSLVQLGKKDMYTLEYTVVGSNMPSYLNYIDESYLDTTLFDIERIIGNEEAEKERIKEELEEEKKREEERKIAEEEAKKKAEEEAKNKKNNTTNTNTSNTTSPSFDDFDIGSCEDGFW